MGGSARVARAAGLSARDAANQTFTIQDADVESLYRSFSDIELDLKSSPGIMSSLNFERVLDVNWLIGCITICEKTLLLAGLHEPPFLLVVAARTSADQDNFIHGRRAISARTLTSHPVKFLFLFL